MDFPDYSINKENLQKLSIADLHALLLICEQHRDNFDDDNLTNDADERWNEEAWYYYDQILHQLYDEINRRITALAGPVVHKAEDPDANALITPSRANEDYVEEAFSPYQEDYYCPICQQELPAPGAGCIRCDQL